MLGKCLLGTHLEPESGDAIETLNSEETWEGGFKISPGNLYCLIILTY